MLNDKSRILLVYGGAGAGKSWAVAQKLIINILYYYDKKILCIRKTFPSLRLTSLELITNLLNLYRIPYNLNKSEYIIYTIHNNRIIFKGLDDPEKIQSITDVDYIWIEEATELTKEEFMQCNLRLRGQELPKGHYRQLIATFNPIGENNWIYKNYFNRDIDDVKRYKYNYRSNNFLDSEYINELERLKEQDEELYRVFTLGEWGQLTGLIFPNWTTAKKIPEGVTYYGLDFGYENPTALIEVTQREDELYVKELIYKTHLTNSELIEEMKSLNIKGTIIADSAEPNRIEEIYKAGFDIRPANKGKDSIRLGIDFLKRFKVYMVDSPNIEKERSTYAFKKDKKGEPLDEPVEYNNHAIDAIRYATSFNLTRRKLRVSVI